MGGSSGGISLPSLRETSDGLEKLKRKDMVGWVDIYLCKRVFMQRPSWNSRRGPNIPVIYEGLRS